MTDNKSEGSNIFQNPFSKKKPKPEPEPQPDPAAEQKKDEEEVLDDGKDNAIQNLIFHSFYLSAWAVPLEENLITIKENVPELMKAKDNDPLLQETIKTFHEIMKEKDDEILNLRRQNLNNDPMSNFVEVQSEIIQTDLTLEECNEMERQITVLAIDLPEKNERIYQLQQELAKQQQLLGHTDGQSIQENISKPSESKIMEELEESYKNLMELEEANAILQKQNDELTERHKLLQFQFDDIKELKMEIEDAKIQTEDDLHRLEEVLENKDLELKRLNEQLKSPMNTAIKDSDENQPDMVNDEIEVIRRTYENQIEQLNKRVEDTGHYEKSHKVKTYKSQRSDCDIDDVIVELKEKIYNESPVSRLLPFLSENIITEYSLQRYSDKEIISELIKICCEEKTSEEELVELVPILKSIAYHDNGTIDAEKVKDNIEKYKIIYSKFSKEQLVHEAFNNGLQLKIRENVNKLNINNLKREYMKLENILNIINNVFKLTQLRVLNRMSRNDLIDGIIEKMATILDISMHTFWDVILNKQLKETDVNKTVILTDTDKRILFCTLFHRFEDPDTFLPITTMLMNVRSILLYGELSMRTKRENAIFFMKLYSMHIIHDINNHILPKYPREIRCRLMETPIEDSLVDLYKVQDNISSEFLALLVDSNKTLNQPGYSGYAWTILDILSLINFEDDLFVILTNSSKLELPGYILGISNSSKKIEKSLIKIGLQKSTKTKLIDSILRIQFILNKEEINSMSEHYPGKSEMELLKILIKKKETLLKFIFKDSFAPPIERMPLPRNSRYLSCVSKEKVAVDFWVKMILDKYHKEQMKDLQSLTEEELEICFKRLLKAMELVCPYLLGDSKEIKNNKKDLVKLVFTYRNIIIRKLQESLIGRRCRLQLSQEVYELLQGVKIQDVPSEDQLEIIKRHFETSIPDIELPELNDVLKRLYDIDCELFPGIPVSSIKPKDFRKLKSEEILEEIMYLRLALSSSMVFMTGSWEDLKHTIESDVDRWNVMKKIESIIFNADLMEIDKDLIDTERNLMTRILKNCKRFRAINDEKLRKAFMEIKQISCRNNTETFDMTENMKYFDKIATKAGRVQILCGEVENIMNSFKKQFDTDETDTDFVDKYMKLELLLEDMEMGLSDKNVNFQQTWIYSLYDKVREIKIIISNDSEVKPLKVESIRSHIMNYLQDIKLWVSNTQKSQAKSFARLNNVIRKLNNSSAKNERKVKLSSNDMDSEELNDEMRAFDRALSEVEERIRELDGENSNKENYGKMIEIEIMNKNADALKKLILSLKTELAMTNIGTSDLRDTEIWLSNRTKEQLQDDCQNLAHKVLVKKLYGFLNEDSNDAMKAHSSQGSNLSLFEKDLNSKLMRYQDLCDSQEFKITPVASKDRNFALPSNERDTFSGVNQYTRVNQDPTQSHKFRKSNVPLNADSNIDVYYQQRLGEFQNYMKSSEKGNFHSKNPMYNIKNLHNSDVLVDGFEIEDEKTSRYYSMKLQDLQHERKEDELGAILYQMEQQRLEILEKNKYLQQQVFVSQNLIGNLQKKLDCMDSTDGSLRQKKRPIEQNGIHNQEERFLKDETSWITSRLLEAQQQLDYQNSELINLAIINDNLQYDKTNLTIKNTFLQRSFHKLEVLYDDLVRQLESAKLSSLGEIDDFAPKMKESELEKLLRQSEADKMELVKKLDILDEQNQLLKNQCEKLDIELLSTNKSLSNSQSLADNYLKQAKQLTDMLDGMQFENERYQAIAISPLIKGKEEEIKRLKIKIHQLETKLMMDNQI